MARGERSVTFVMSGFLEITIPYFRVALDNLLSSFISCASQFEKPLGGVGGGLGISKNSISFRNTGFTLSSVS